MYLNHFLQVIAKSVHLVSRSEAIMGNCLTAGIVARIRRDMMRDFFSKSIIGQLTTALTAPDSCDEPTTNEALRGYMQCAFLKGQREAWELILLLFIGQFSCILILLIIIYKKGKKAIIQYQSNSQGMSLRILGSSAAAAPGISTQVSASASASLSARPTRPKIPASSRIERVKPRETSPGPPLDRESLDF